MTTVFNMTRKQLLNTPEINCFYGSPISFTSFIIIPSKTKHESGFELMDVILLKEYEVIGKVKYKPDVLSFEKVNKELRVECLPKSHCLHFWTRGEVIVKSSDIAVRINIL